VAALHLRRRGRLPARRDPAAILVGAEVEAELESR
jgi:hypothetical protein